MEKEKIDLLSRDKFIENVIKLVDQLSSAGQGSCFAIEGEWGIGKTFVIEQLEERLSVIQSERRCNDKYFVFHYNCWQYDYYEEPAVAIISAMLYCIQKEEALLPGEMDETAKAGLQLAKGVLEEIAGKYIENKIGVNIVSLRNDIEEKKSDNTATKYGFDKMFNFNQTIEETRKKLEKIAEERTLVFVVDELDRCIPHYAIKILERIHHIFSGLKNVVVIMAIDRTQLEHSVEDMFGAGQTSMDVEKYLKKFIDFSMILDYGKINHYFVKKYAFYFEKFYINGELKDKEIVTNVISQLFDEMDIRIQEKIMQKIDIVHSIICKKPVDSSVIIFEVLFELLKFWKIRDLEHIAFINRTEDSDWEKRLGNERVKIIKSMEEKATHITTIIKENDKVPLKKNIFGYVFWYFSNIYNAENFPYSFDADEYHDVKTELEVVKKYCEFSEIMS